jgi:predicted PolB exonuclease-like 3'-5' exonuclease
LNKKNNLLYHEFERKHLKEFEEHDDKCGAYLDKAALFPPYNQIVCISFGILDKNDGVKIKSIFEKNEENLIDQAAKIFNDSNSFFPAGYNILAFDIPIFIFKCMKYRTMVPYIFAREIDAKPWEKKTYDLFDKIKFGAFKSYQPSLCELCEMLGVDNPKRIGQGADVQDYYAEDDMDRIAEYCEADVVATVECAKIYEKIIQK